MSDHTIPARTLTRKELLNIAFLVLAFSCVVANLTLVVGTGAVVILSVGGSTSLAPFALAVVFIGMSFVSLTASHWIFDRWGRKSGLWVGCAFGIIGVVVACLGLVQSSAAIVLVAEGMLGAGAGIGMYLRFAAVEVVPPEFASKAITWVLAGGCLAAFVGPETAQATKGAFGDGNLTYIGVFVVAGGFFVLQTAFVALIRFPGIPLNGSIDKTSSSHDMETGTCDLGSSTATTCASSQLFSILRKSSFWLPLGASILSWTIMAMPMSIFRVTMKELGFTERQSLTVIEFHFLSMYLPGFWSGIFIKKQGPVRACLVAVVSFFVALGINLSSQGNNNTTSTWFLGLIFLGIGWNFGFSSATVWSTQAYQDAMHLKPQVQAANEFGTFLVSGAAIFSTGYIYQDAGGGGISGWRLLNYILVGCVSLFVLLLIYAWKGKGAEGRARRTRESQCVSVHNDEMSSPIQLVSYQNQHSDS